MIQLILISSIFLVSLLLLFYIIIKNGQGDFYSIIIFSFILATWIIPAIFYFNRTQTSLVNTSSISWIIISVIYFAIQASSRYLLGFLAKYFKSKKIVFSYLLLMYAVIAFITIFVQSTAVIYILVIASSVMGATYGLSAKYWMENTNNKTCYQVNALIYSLPILSLILASSFTQTFSSLNTNLSWSLIFAFLSSISILLGVTLYFLPEKKHINKQDHAFDNEKIIKEFDFKTFIIYPILLSIGGFIYFAILVYMTSHLKTHFPTAPLILVIVFVNFIALIATYLTSEWLIKTFGFFKLNIIGFSLLLIGIVITMIISILFTSLWQLLVVSMAFIIVGAVIINSSILGDIVHIQIKIYKPFLVHCLAAESFGQALGFLFATGLILLNLEGNTAIIILFGFIILMLILYSILVVKNNLLMNNLRRKFVQYEFTILKNNKNKQIID